MTSQPYDAAFIPPPPECRSHTLYVLDARHSFLLNVVRARASCSLDDIHSIMRCRLFKFRADSPESIYVYDFVDGRSTYFVSDVSSIRIHWYGARRLLRRLRHERIYGAIICLPELNAVASVFGKFM
jgi:hypothetical protein